MTTPGKIVQFHVTGRADEETVWALDNQGQLWTGYVATLTPISWHWDKVDGPT